MALSLISFMLLFTVCRPTSTSSLASSPPLHALNITTPFENILKHPSLAARPPDPFELRWRWDGIGRITVTFHGYGAEIRPSLARFCTDQAIQDAFEDHISVWNQAIDKSELQYTGRSPLVVLSVLPRAAMTWNMLYHTALMVQDFMWRFESMSFYFEVEVTSVQGVVAKGNLTIFPEDV